MKLIVGLGNPGSKYETTRHNVGFLLVDQLADEHRISLVPSKFQALIGKARILGEDCVLLQPQTYMNLSGHSIAGVLGYYKIDHEDMIVLHDDVDLAANEVKLKKGGGHGGHNGLRSIIAETKSGEFSRARIGIGRPSEENNKRGISDWVLGCFSQEELDDLTDKAWPEVQRIISLFLDK